MRPVIKNDPKLSREVREYVEKEFGEDGEGSYSCFFCKTCVPAEGERFEVLEPLETSDLDGHRLLAPGVYRVVQCAVQDPWHLLMLSNQEGMTFPLLVSVDMEDDQSTIDWRGTRRWPQPS
jgi:hypothetical protein